MTTMNEIPGRVADGRAPRAPLDPADGLARMARLASRARMLAVMHRMAAHDFNDSLNSLTLNVELLARVLDGDVPADRKAQIEQRAMAALRQELGRLARGTSRVLDAGAQRPQTSERVALAGLVDEVIAGLRHAAQRQRVSMVFPPPATLVEVRGIADDLRLAIFNLALNGIEAMPDGGTLMFTVAADAGRAVVSVADSGAGVPPGLAATMWDLSVSTKPEGLGTGLFVVKDIAADHGGTVECAPQEPGVTFVVRLPLFQ